MEASEDMAYIVVGGKDIDCVLELEYIYLHGQHKYYS